MCNLVKCLFTFCLFRVSLSQCPTSTTAREQQQAVFNFILLQWAVKSVELKWQHSKLFRLKSLFNSKQLISVKVLIVAKSSTGYVKNLILVRLFHPESLAQSSFSFLPSFHLLSVLFITSVFVAFLLGKITTILLSLYKYQSSEEN